MSREVEMKQLLLVCDLDNTVLYSYHQKQPGDVCVERVEEREQGFMPLKAFRLLDALWDKICFVPVTTRSMEQYQRIQWPKKQVPELAFTDNGAVLLRNGHPDAEWARHSRSLAQKYTPAMREIQPVLSSRDGIISCRMVDGLFLYAHFRTEEAAAAWPYWNQTVLRLYHSGRKLYFLPPGIDKGAAVKRLRIEREQSLIVCAGDSEMDVTMLESADLALLPAEGIPSFPSGRACCWCPASVSFPEFVFSCAQSLLK